MLLGGDGVCEDLRDLGVPLEIVLLLPRMLRRQYGQRMFLQSLVGIVLVEHTFGCVVVRMQFVDPFPRTMVSFDG